MKLIELVIDAMAGVLWPPPDRRTAQLQKIAAWLLMCGAVAAGGGVYLANAYLPGAVVPVLIVGGHIFFAGAIVAQHAGSVCKAQYKLRQAPSSAAAIETPRT